MEAPPERQGSPEEAEAESKTQEQVHRNVQTADIRPQTSDFGGKTRGENSLDNPNIGRRFFLTWVLRPAGKVRLRLVGLMGRR